MAVAAQQIAESGALRRVSRAWPVQTDLPGESALQVTAEVFWVPGIRPRQAFFCLPGGGMHRQYFDLQSPGDDSFNFAQQMARRGFLVVAVDPLGIGASSRPVDGHALTVERLADVHAQVCDQLALALREGSLDSELAPLSDLHMIGLGHSMGAMLTIAQQARHGQHAAVALLGFCTAGLPQYLSPQVKELLAEPAKLREQIIDLAKKMFPDPYPDLNRGAGASGGIYGSGHAQRAGIEALKMATDRLLPTPAFQSILPGNVAAEAAAIEVPVFLGIGEQDMIDEPQVVPASFPASAAVELRVFAGMGHAHFLYPSRVELFDALAAWARSLPNDSPTNFAYSGEQA